jgi:hypothetical protein
MVYMKYSKKTTMNDSATWALEAAPAACGGPIFERKFR